MHADEKSFGEQLLDVTCYMLPLVKYSVGLADAHTERFPARSAYWGSQNINHRDRMQDSKRCKKGTVTVFTH